MQLKAHTNSKFTMNFALNLWNLEDGSDICVCFLKLKRPKYLYERIPSESHIYSTRNSENVETYYCRTDHFKYSFFPYSIIEWNKLDINLRNAKSFLIFRNSLLKIGRPMQNSIYNIHDPVGIKYLTRLRLGLSHLNEHKFRHNFQDCLNPSIVFL